MAVQMASSRGAQVAVRGLNHFTLPVRDRYTAARFYSAVFNCEIDHESSPDRVAKGLARSLQVGVKLCNPFWRLTCSRSFSQHSIGG